MMYGADADELDRLSVEFARAADDLDRDGGLMTQLLNNVSWMGDVASRFVGGWTGIQLPKIGLSTRFLREASDQLARNARDQRAASAGATGGATSDVARPVSGPSPVAIDEQVRERESKSGAVIRGVDGSEIRFRRMSDGTYEVVVTLANGTTLDAGDAAALWGIAHGKFFTEEGIEWDFDASLMTEGSTTFTFTDEASARKFFEALGEQQDSLGSTISGLSWYDVMGVAKRLDGQLAGDVDWTGYRGATTASAEGSFGIRVGDDPQSASTSVAISGTKGFATETHFSDGSTGEMSSMSGTIAGHGEVKIGDVSVDAAGLAGYERQVHLVRDASGVPLRLEVAESYTAAGTAQGGIEFLGTGASESIGTVGRVESTKVFDLTDPSVAATFDADAGAGGMFAWSQEHSALGGQTVSTYTGTSMSSSSSLLYSGEWTSASESSVLTGSSYRAPGSTDFVSYVGDMRPHDGMSPQIVNESDGTSSVVWTGTY